LPKRETRKNIKSLLKKPGGSILIKLILTPEGLANLVEIFLITLLGLAMVLFVQFQLLQHKKFDIRSKLLLCARKAGVRTQKHFHRQVRVNQAIAIAKALAPTDVIFVYSRVIRKATILALKASQQAFYFSYLKKIEEIPECHLATGPQFTIKYPFQRSLLVLKRKNDLLTLQRKKWKITILPLSPIIKSSLSLKWEIKSSLNATSQFKITEEQIPLVL
jgi:hypothetical protein